MGILIQSKSTQVCGSCALSREEAAKLSGPFPVLITTTEGGTLKIIGSKSSQEDQASAVFLVE